jgi:hypothetical protein
VKGGNGRNGTKGTHGRVPGGAVALTKGQMAGALQISVRSLNSMMAKGQIDFWRITPRLVRFRIEDAVRRMNETVLVPGDEG